MSKATEYIVIREVSTDQLRICRIVVGYVPPDDPSYTWAGRFKSKRAAEKAIASGEIEPQLYPETSR